MDIKNIADSLLTFTIKRLIEFSGLFISVFGILIFIALISYSPLDPNFIFPENREIKNLLGFRGSYVSDLLLQSVGFIAYLIPFTYIFTGITIFKNLKIFLLIENTFLIIGYSLVGSSFFSFFYKDAFELFINGNGGFVGNYLSENFIRVIINPYENIFFYLFILLIIILFFMSVNFKFKKFIQIIRKIYQFIIKKNTRNYTNRNEIINEYIPQEKIKSLIQEDLPL